MEVASSFVCLPSLQLEKKNVSLQPTKNQKIGKIVMDYGAIFNLRYPVAMHVVFKLRYSVAIVQVLGSTYSYIMV